MLELKDSIHQRSLIATESFLMLEAEVIDNTRSNKTPLVLSSTFQGWKAVAGEEDVRSWGPKERVDV